MNTDDKQQVFQLVATKLLVIGMINAELFTLKNKLMKALAAITVLGIMTLSACSENGKPQTTAPADYAETEQQLIQNREKDSLMGDSINAATAMPPQQAPEKSQNQSGLHE